MRAKDKILSITNTIATAKPAPEIKIGIVGYRDRGDRYITRMIEMTEDLDFIYKELLEFKVQGGGDTPESVNQALYDTVTKNSWSKNNSVYKVIFLVGDAPPHMNCRDDVKYRKTCKLASEKGITINTIQCGNLYGTEPVWKKIAQLTNGEYFRVSQQGDSKDYKTPYDKIISEKARELDDTRVYYGNAEF